MPELRAKFQNLYMLASSYGGRFCTLAPSGSRIKMFTYVTRARSRALRYTPGHGVSSQLAHAIEANFVSMQEPPARSTTELADYQERLLSFALDSTHEPVGQCQQPSPVENGRRGAEFHY